MPRERDDPVALGHGGAVPGDAVGRGAVQQHGARGQLRGQRPDQLAGQVLDPRERPEHATSEQRRHGRVGAQEARRGGDERAVDHEVVQRHVVAAEPPAPRRRAAGLAEHPQVVQAGVPAALAVEDRHEPLGVVEDVLQAHRGRDGDVPGRRETRRDQPHRGPLLGGSLRVHGEPTVVRGGVEPAPPLGVRRVVRGDGADGHRALRGVEGVEPRARGSGHAVGDRAGGGDVADDGTHRQP